MFMQRISFTWMLLCLLTVQALSAAQSAAALLEQVKDERGLCVYLGATDGTVAALGAQTKMLVHAVSWDDTFTADVHKAIAAKSVQGFVQHEVFAGASLPYVSDMANVIIVEDADRVNNEEIKRVLTPGGLLVIREKGKWKKIDRSYPSGMHEWTHPACAADGNRVIDESITFPLGLRWQDGLPLNIGHWASNRGWVTSKGRVFTISMNEFENLPNPGATWGKKEQWLHARSSANGIHLWKAPLGTYDEKGDLNPLNSAPLATDGEVVLCTKADKLVSIDAQTGDIRQTLATAYKPIRLNFVDGVAVVVSWEALRRLKMWDPASKPSSAVWDIWTPKANKGAIEAFDVETGKKIWGEQEVAQTVFVTGSTVVYLIQGPAPVKEQFVVGRDLKSGKELWRTSHANIGVKPNMFLAGVGEGVVALAHHKEKTENFKLRCEQLTVISAASGKKLWDVKKPGDVMVMFAEGDLWYGAHSYDPQTGQVKGKAPINLTRRMCVPPVVVGGVGGTPRGSQWTDIQNNSRLDLGGVRGACVQGVAVSEKRLYVAQNFCRCSPGQLPGFLAMGSEAIPSDKAFKAKRPVITGHGVADKNATVSSWSTFRADAERSAIVEESVTEQAKLQWQKSLVAPNKHPLTTQWKQSLSMPLTAPVANDSLFIVAAVNKGTVYALKQSDGSIAWTAQCNSRIDAPPTLYKGLCLTPCHDGWVHAFSTADGALVYKVRIAPAEKRMVSFAQVESSWPVIGSPLVKDGVAYAIAGRSTEIEGGCAVVAFNPLTGKSKWANKVSGGQRCADVLQWFDGAVRMQNKRIDPQSGNVAKIPPVNTDRRVKENLSGILDGTWFYVGNRRSGNHVAGKINADILISSADTWYGFGTSRGNHGVFAISHEAAMKSDPKNQGAGTFKWQHVCSGLRVTALAACKNAVVIGGYVKSSGKGSLCVVSRASGKVMSEQALSSAPVVHGIAVSNEAIVATLIDGSVVSCK